ncbi:MAG: TlpA family protein disulfide reductase [Ktedonobacterales bacterium]|nr:TlpA family protein disulfide reductase [Ktedonobacterales bacterium]
MRHIPTALRRSVPTTPTQWLRAGVLLAALLAVALGIAARALAGPPQTAPRLLGQAAPAFALPAEQGGRQLPGTITLAAQRGHPTLLVFFYTLCPRCLSEVQAAQSATHDRATRGASVLYISSPAERPDIVDAYLGRLGISAPALLDAGGQLAARYRIRFYPTTVLVDARGVVRGVWMGETSAATLTQALAAL